MLLERAPVSLVANPRAAAARTRRVERDRHIRIAETGDRCERIPSLLALVAYRNLTAARLWGQLGEVQHV